jgi:methanogenic corrinoid protein MtbC1
VQELARLSLEHDTLVAASFIETMRLQGASVESIYMDLLAPTARRLGEMWTEDLCDFTDVTVGLSRLQQLCHELSPDFENEGLPQYDEHRILLSTIPGEQHTLGLMLVEEYFRRAGWECCSIAPKSTKDLVKIVKKQHYDVVGLSVSCGIFLEGVASAVQVVRRASHNEAVKIMVGGPIFLDHPEYAARVGADGTAEDGRQAVLQLRDMMAVRKGTSIR